MPYGDGPAMASFDSVFDVAELGLLTGWVLVLAALSPDFLESAILVVEVVVVVEEDWGGDVGVDVGAGKGKGSDEVPVV